MKNGIRVSRIVSMIITCMSGLVFAIAGITCYVWWWHWTTGEYYILDFLLWALVSLLFTLLYACIEMTVRNCKDKEQR